MSLSTYAELQTDIAAWLHRDDLTARIPDFIKLGEAVLNRRLRTVDMETRATASTSTTSRFMGLPSGFIEMRSLSIQDPAREVIYIEPRYMRDYVYDETTTGIPEKFTVKDEIEFNCIPDQVYTLELHYFKKYDIATDSTNWLLTNYPEIYLHSALAAAAFYVIDDTRLSTVKSLLEEGIKELNRSEARKRGNHMSTLRVDSAITAFRNYNIITGA